LATPLIDFYKQLLENLQNRNNHHVLVWIHILLAGQNPLCNVAIKITEEFWNSLFAWLYFSQLLEAWEKSCCKISMDSFFKMG